MQAGRRPRFLRLDSTVSFLGRGWLTITTTPTPVFCVGIDSKQVSFLVSPLDATFAGQVA